MQRDLSSGVRGFPPKSAISLSWNCPGCKKPSAKKQGWNTSPTYPHLATLSPNSHLIGPHFLARHLTGVTYLDMLRTVIPDLLDDVPLAVPLDDLYNQRDGCPAHYQHAVREHLNSVFPQRWIGRGGPVPWPARGPDLTPLDLWSELKRLVISWRTRNTRRINNCDSGRF